MAGSGLKRRRRLFDVYSKNLSFYCSNVPPNYFVCPICFRGFTREAIEAKTLQVDIAHVYPESCGGSANTLTCKQCNSRMGGRFDRQLFREHQSLLALMKATGSIRTRVRFSTGSVGVEWSRWGDGFELKVIGKQTNPHDEEALKAELAKGPGASFTIGLPWINPRWHNVAILHAAYLALFRQWGYEYVLYAHTQWIRDILVAEEPPKKVMIPMSAIPSTMMVAGNTQCATGIADVLDVGRFFAVKLPSPDPSASGRLVLMPGIGEPAVTAYSRLLEKEGQPLQLRHRFSYGLGEDLLQHKGIAGLMHRVWRMDINQRVL